MRKSNIGVERKNMETETGKDRGKHWIEICADIVKRKSRVAYWDCRIKDPEGVNLRNTECRCKY